MVRLGAHQPAPREPFSSRHSSRDSDDSALPWQLLLSKAGGHLQQAVQERSLPVDKEQQVRTEVQDGCGHAPELEGRLRPQDSGQLGWWHRLVAHIWNLTIRDVEVGRLQVPGQLESQSTYTKDGPGSIWFSRATYSSDPGQGTAERPAYPGWTICLN